MTMFEDIQNGQTAEFLVDGAQGLWRLHRVDETWVIESPSLTIETADFNSAMRSALLENLCLEWPQGCRFAMNGSDDLCFEYALTNPPDEAVLELVSSIWASLQEQAQAMDFVDPDKLSMETVLQANEEDTLQEHLQELRALQKLSDADPELSALFSIDEVDGVGVFEPDDESWFVGVRPSLREGSLTLSLALELIPEGEQAGKFMRCALRLASARRLGAQHTLGCDPEATTLVLSTDLNVYHSDAQAIKAAIGGLILLGDRLGPEMVVSQDKSPRDREPSLATLISDSLAAYQLYIRI
jgi:hypothetical protein